MKLSKRQIRNLILEAVEEVNPRILPNDELLIPPGELSGGIPPDDELLIKVRDLKGEIPLDEQNVVFNYLAILRQSSERIDSHLSGKAKKEMMAWRDDINWTKGEIKKDLKRIENAIKKLKYELRDFNL